MLIKKNENKKIIKNQGEFMQGACRKEIWQLILLKKGKYLKSRKKYKYKYKYK